MFHAAYLSHLLTPSAKQKQPWKPWPEAQATPSSLDTKVKFLPYLTIYAYWSWTSSFSRRDDFFSCLSPTDASVYRDLECTFRYSEYGNGQNPLQIQTLMASLTVPLWHSWKHSKAIQTHLKNLSICFCTEVKGRTSYKVPASVRKKAYSKIHHYLIHHLPIFKTLCLICEASPKIYTFSPCYLQQYQAFLL